VPEPNHEQQQSGMVRSLEISSTVYGNDGVDENDPAELFHETSKFYPSFAARQAPGMRLVEDEEDIQQAISRAIRRRGSGPVVRLPEPGLPPLPIAEVIRRRRTRYAFAPEPMSLGQLSALLHFGYGITEENGEPDVGAAGPCRRAAPSGGALYPLEVYAVVHSVDGLDPGLYQFDPFERALRTIRGGPQKREIGGAMLYPEIGEAAGVVLLFASVFWRNRFKYGLRGYRFALMEAGHVGQNMLLAAEALGLAAAPIGGFYDERVDKLLELDGVNESTLYLLAFASRPDDVG
jgi:SagB-type dehydrogenase family enzyme